MLSFIIFRIFMVGIRIRALCVSELVSRVVEYSRATANELKHGEQPYLGRISVS